MAYDTPIGPMPESTPPPESDALSSLVSSFFNEARSRIQSQDFGSIFNDALSSIQSQPGPTALPVPAPMHPVGQIASAFASSLAEQLGSPRAAAAHQERVAQNESARKQAEQTNILRQDEFQYRKATQELSVRMRINEAKMEQAKQLGMLDEYEARLKASSALRREQSQLDADMKLKQIDVQNKAILDRVLKEVSARGNEARKTVNYRTLLKTAIDTAKASDALKMWGRLQQQRIFAKDIAGEYIYDPAQQEKMAEQAYQEFLSKQADEKNPNQQSNDFFDQMFNE
jgi:hypothetical protein